MVGRRWHRGRSCSASFPSSLLTTCYLHYLLPTRCFLAARAASWARQQVVRAFMQRACSSSFWGGVSWRQMIWYSSTPPCPSGSSRPHQRSRYSGHQLRWRCQLGLSGIVGLIGPHLADFAGLYHSETPRSSAHPPDPQHLRAPRPSPRSRWPERDPMADRPRRRGSPLRCTGAGRRATTRAERGARDRPWRAGCPTGTDRRAGRRARARP